MKKLKAEVHYVGTKAGLAKIGKGQVRVDYYHALLSFNPTGATAAQLLAKVKTLKAYHAAAAEKLTASVRGHLTWWAREKWVEKHEAK